MSSATYRVALVGSNHHFNVSPDTTLLQAAHDAGIVLPSSCRNGTCRTCLCQLHSGGVHYRIEWPGLSRAEKDNGFILPCVAYPMSDLVVDEPRAIMTTISNQASR